MVVHQENWSGLTREGGRRSEVRGRGRGRARERGERGDPVGVVACKTKRRDMSGANVILGRGQRHGENVMQKGEL